jgi:biopolymer transport protein ExbD
MRLTKHRRKTMAAMDMTPMIDITFQLMIFFMTCTQVSQLNNERLDLPQLKGSQDQQETTTITVNVDQDGEIKVSGRPFTVTELVNAVGDELAAAENEPSRIHVVIRADKRGTSRTVNEVVTALAKQGIQQVRIAVEATQ